MPTEWIDDGTIGTFQWNQDRSTGTAALIIFFTLCHYAALYASNPFIDAVMATRLTYDDINHLTGLSRKLISKGLSRLEAAGMISRLDDSSGRYAISGLDSGQRWAKLPCRALLSPAKTSFHPFLSFTLRSLHELNAMKLYLYYVGIRDRKHPYSASKYETICRRVIVSERHIPGANALLVATGLLSRIERRVDGDEDQPYGANHYFMAGYKDVFIPAAK